MQYQTGNDAGQGPAKRLAPLRGVAILGVIAIHTSAHFTYVDNSSLVVRANIVVDVLAHFAVPLFILLSGIALTLRYGSNGAQFDAGQFYKRRLARIIPPYVVFSLLYLLLFSAEYGPPELLWVPLALLTGSAYYHLWFVALLLQLYLLYPWLRGALRWTTRRNAAGPLLLAAFLLQLAWNLGAPLLRDALADRPLFETVFSERFFLSHLFYFLLGMAAGVNLTQFKARVCQLPPGLLALAVAAPAALIAWRWSDAVMRYGSLAAAPPAHFLPAVAIEPVLFLATIAGLWRLSEGLTVAAPLVEAHLARLGALSLPIYLIHVFWQWALRRTMAGYGVTP